ncbi:MAG TPA: EAL domain-containing protein [Solirubrobacteraceae bacterium]|jgi:diguanylate cyclase (GGDEF)-like protein|nr:EAL domain-containing protein [Solirubrobacteraceae bacterium]
MSDSEIPQENPPAESFAQPADGAQSIAAAAAAHEPIVQEPTAQEPSAQEPSAEEPAGVRELLRSRKLVWALVAVLCVAAGAVASVLGAHAVAHGEAGKAQQSSQQSAAAIASTVKLSLRHEEDLAVGASTYFAANSNTSPNEFAVWVKWARTLRRFPELDGLTLVAPVPATALAAFHARITGQTLKPTTTSTAPTSATKPTSATSASSAASALRVVPAGSRATYCLAIANLVRGPAKSPPAGLDYCSVTPRLLASRDTGASIYTPAHVGRTKALAINTPVYRGNVLPRTVLGRTAASVGWVREVLTPGVLLQEALRGHEASAVSLTYHSGSTRLAFAGGTPQAGAQSTTIALHNGWTVQSFTGVPANTVLGDGDALALLIVGCVLSALLGVLVFLLGGGRAPVLVRVRAPQTSAAPAEDLHDSLTGLPNRALMLDRAECMLARAGRQSGLLVGALFIDIDWFKDVNERLGQAAGDQILKIVSERLEGVVRAGDTVGRLGGDEFVVLVESAARGARLDSLARRMVEALHKPFNLDDFGPNFFLTASIGVAFGRYAAPDDLLRDAQLALYAAKSAGKDRYTLFNANMRSVIEGRGVLEAELNTALAEKEFFVLYEPIYDLNTGRVAGLEALVRWMHPKRGVVLPDDFIPLAEETGMTVPIGRWVLEEACARAASWHVAGHRVGVSVAVTPNQLNRDGFVIDVRRALQQSGIEPAMLTLAIAETTVMGDVTAAVERLEEIKQLGVRIAIDDFGGSGYAYHSDLRRLPLDFLRVDRSSLAASEDEDYRTWLLEAILIVGRDLSLTVIAKGIDSFEQMSALQSMGCTMAQGALMGKPVPANAIENVLGTSIPTVHADPQSL